MTQQPPPIEPSPAAVPPPAPPALRTSLAAVAGFIFGLISPCTAGLAGVPGLILSLVALRRIRRSGGRLTGRGLAIAGIVLSSVGLAILMMLVAIAAAAHTCRVNWKYHAPRRAWPPHETASGTLRQKAAESMVSLATLGEAALWYADDHDGLLPDAAAYPRALREYIEQLPGGRADAPEGRRFVMNAALSRLSLDDLDEPCQTVLFFEGTAAGPARGGRAMLRPLEGDDDAYVIGFADGHIGWLSAEEIEDLIWDPFQSEPPAKLIAAAWNGAGRSE
jgi:hypothetical protein